MSTNSQLKIMAKEDLKGNFGTCILGSIISTAIIGFSNAIPFGSIVVSGPFNVGMQSIYNSVTDREKADLKDLFSGFTTNFGENFLMQLLKVIFIVLWSLLFLIPGIVKGYSYAMSGYLMARDKNLSASDAIKYSMDLMKEHRMELFGLQLSFIGWYLLTILTCGILLLYVVPYYNVTRTEFFNDIYYNTSAADYD